MKKLYKVLSSCIAVSLLMYIGFEITVFLKDKKEFEKSSREYIENKYTEKMIYGNVEYNIEEGFYRIVHPEKMAELKFSVKYNIQNDKYCDTYLQEFLRNEICENINEIVEPYSANIKVDLRNITPYLNVSIYNKYLELNKPATWEDLNLIVEAERVSIYFENIPEQKQLREIICEISALNYDISTLKILQKHKKKVTLIYSLQKSDIEQVLTTTDLSLFCVATNKS